MVGPLSLKLGLFNAAAGAGYETAGNTANPDVELAFGMDMGMFGFNVGVVSQTNVTYEVPAASETESATYEKYSSLAYSVAANVKVAMVDASFVYSGGNPDYANATSGAVQDKDGVDTIMGLSSHLSFDLSMVKLNVFYGMETLNLLKDNHSGATADTENTASTVGVGLGHTCKNGVNWAAEYVMSEGKVDGTEAMNKSFIALSASKSFSS